VGHDAGARQQHGDGVSRPASPARSRSTASATAPRCRADLNLQLGYSHDIPYPIPQDIQIACEKPTLIAISGADRQRVGQVAAEIRSYRPPEPYKGKGVKYADETDPPQGRQEEVTAMAKNQPNSFSAESSGCATNCAKARQIAPAAVGVPLVEAYLRADHRRCGGPHAGRGLDARRGGQKGLKTGADSAAAKASAS
jgi:hypothetical protein